MNISDFDRNDFLFEISWEVCNKVGGIFTVITSKISEILKKVDYDKYFAVGPYFENTIRDGFISKKCPDFIEDANKELSSVGIKIHYGEWKISSSSKSQVLLVEYLGHSSNINLIKGKLWEHYKIDSLGSNWYDFDEAILWSWCCGIVIEKMYEILGRKGEGFSSNFFVHSHEWMAGGAVLNLKCLDGDLKDKFKCVFTTHATMLGRALSGSRFNIYEVDRTSFDAGKKAYDIGVHTKHQTEKAIANVCDCFTTVSEITASEAEFFYGKKVDKLLYNGFDVEDFDFLENFDLVYRESRSKVIQVLKMHFGEKSGIDFKSASVFYTSGRNEFRNKGLDVYIKALGKLNSMLKKSGKNESVINLFLIPVGDFKRLSKEDLEKFSHMNYSSYSTHNIPADNEIIRCFMDNGLYNKKSDKVKVLLVPIYLKYGDDVFSLNYYDLICGLDLGVFPSFYEPWGYTPLESIAFCTPAVTSDFAGFGRAILQDYKDVHEGIIVLNREKRKEEDIVENLGSFFNQFLMLEGDMRLAHREKARKFSKHFSWKKFIFNYFDAYNIAKNK